MGLLASKKGMFMSFRDWLSFFVGLVLLLIGIIPLLNMWNVISFGLPGFLSGLVGSIFFWIIAIAGGYIIIDGMIEPPGHAIHKFLILLGIIFILIGLLPILNTFNVINLEIPFLASLVVYNIIIAIEGLMLMSAGFTMR